MSAVPPVHSVDELAPPAGKATIVFMRPGRYGRGRPSVWTEDSGLVGILPPRTYAVHTVDPGEHRFMVRGSESAHFLEAEVEEGGVYFALVYARPGWAAARFSLTPIEPGTEAWDRIPERIRISRQVIFNPQVKTFESTESPRTEKLWSSQFPRWTAKANRPVLREGA